MSVKCQVVMNTLDVIAPRYLAESWDNVGLMVGSPAREIEKILVCLDASELVIERAVAEKVDLIVAHHPLIFKPMKNLRTDLPLGRMLAKLIQHDIAVFAAHTNLDIADGGVNDVLTERLSLEDVSPLTITYEPPLVKLAVFVPINHAEEVRLAIGKAGAGSIGGYSHCSFQSRGKGYFLPEAGAQPFIGKVGTLESVDEVRLETILPEKLVGKVIRAMLKAHPYEETAYDLYPLKNTGKVAGLGRIGRLRVPMELDAFAMQVKQALGGNHVRIVKGSGRLIRKAALCSGSGAEFITKAAYAGADVLVTGDVKYHDAQKAVECGIHVIDAGHFGTEMPIAGALAEHLREVNVKEKWNVEIIADEWSKDLFSVI